MKAWWLLAALAAALSPQAQSHPLAPALLDLREAASAPGAARYSALWRTSVSRVRGADVQPVLPEDCHAAGEARTSAEENQSLVRRWELLCAQRLNGRVVRIDGLERSGINVILRFAPLQGPPTSRLLAADQPEVTLPAAPAALPVFQGYFSLGVEHLLLGFDHVLLVLGLMLLVRGLRRLVLTVTAFTLGHSVTLALATLGLVTVDQRITELAIAGSILYLAVELTRPNLPRRAEEGKVGSILLRWPWAMAALFGLLHGLGFAGALAEVGLPAGEIPVALLAFNLGIETGQLVLIAVLLIAGMLSQRLRLPAPAGHVAALAPVYLIGSLAAFWCFERAELLL